MTKLAIITTHPVQYYAPVFRLLAQQLEVKVFYTWGKQVLEKKYDPGFKREIEWDIPLLDGYNYHFTQNDAKNPGSHHSKGIINPHLIAEIKTFKADAILIYGHTYHSHLRVMRYFKGKTPIYFRGDSTLLDDTNFVLKPLKTIYLSWVYNFVDHAFYVGAANKAYYKQYGLKESQLIFGPHAIDNERFSIPRLKEVGDLRRKLGLLENDILILFAGKFENKKSPLLLKESFIQLNNPHTHLLFVGNGVLEEELKGGMAGSGKVKDGKLESGKMEGAVWPLNDVKNRIHFMDFQNQSYMPVIYQACNLFVLPSKGPGETWGLAVNEAMACGKAILVSDKVGCAQDLVINGENGYIFESGNQEDFNKKLKRLVQQDFVEMGQKSLQIINAWTFQRQVDIFAKLIETRID